MDKDEARFWLAEASRPALERREAARLVATESQRVRRNEAWAFVMRAALEYLPDMPHGRDAIAIIQKGLKHFCGHSQRELALRFDLKPRTARTITSTLVDLLATDLKDESPLRETLMQFTSWDLALKRVRRARNERLREAAKPTQFHSGPFKPANTPYASSKR